MILLQRRVTLTVDENLPGNTVIGTVAAIDDDKNPIYYYIISKLHSYFPIL